jgi:transcription elongation factor GreA
MQGSNNIYLTPTGFQNLKSKCNRLYKERVALGRELEAVKEPGRQVENHSYTAVRNRALQIETHMEQINHTLQNAVLIKKPKQKHTVARGSTVKLKSGHDIKKFTLVGSVEADPSYGYLSDHSPVGKQLLDARVGDTVYIGNGHVTAYTVLSIG